MRRVILLPEEKPFAGAIFSEELSLIPYVLGLAVISVTLPGESHHDVLEPTSAFCTVGAES